MMLDRKSLNLYLVTDRRWHEENAFLEKIEESLKAGVTFLQIREKNIEYDLFLKRAIEMKQLAEKYDIPFVVNDNLEIAIESNADGIHIGQGDLPASEVRKRIGNDKILGVSVGTAKEAIKAERDGADYLGVGAVFSTGSKSDAILVDQSEVKKICEAVDIPVIAIGGINEENILELQGLGLVGVAVISAILAKENIVKATQDLKIRTKQISQDNVPKTLTIAGSDCSGGAGIQADLKAMSACGCYAMSVITALTAQNTTGVYGIEDCSAEFVSNQMKCIFEDIMPDAVKIGMVSSVDIIETIAKGLEIYNPKYIVLDPVMVATSGSKLLKDEAVEALKKHLIPMASIITPNLSEAEILSGKRILSEDDMVEAAKSISNYYNGYVLIKGGHLEKNANDLLYKDGSIDWIEGRRIKNNNTHGTGCTLSSAIASGLAKGLTVKESVVEAKSYLTRALKDQMNLGCGSGPLNHFSE